MIKRILHTIIAISSITLLAQKNGASIYSSQDIGLNTTQNTVEENAMGGIGVAMTQINYLNFVNPAAYANLRFTTYGIAGVTSFINVKNNTTSQFSNFTKLQYVSLGLPFGKKAGFSVGLRPTTSVGYSFINKIYDADNELMEVSRFKGKGGANKLYGSFGMFLYKGLSVGVEGAYIFGNITKTILNQEQNTVLATKYENNASVRGVEAKLGLQYKLDLKSKMYLSSGIAVKLSSRLKYFTDESVYSLSVNNSGAETPVDTLFTANRTSKIKYPMQTVLGLGIGKRGKWYVGLNTEFKEALSNTNLSNFSYDDAFRTSLGGYYIPKANSISSYWNRVTYRGGIRFEKTGLLIKDNTKNGEFSAVNDFGINFGFGLPLPKQISNLNLGFEYGQRGTDNNNLIKENYYNIRLSLSLNSLDWFKKRKID